MYSIIKNKAWFVFGHKWISLIFNFKIRIFQKKHVINNIPGRIYFEVIRPKTRDESVTLQAIIDNVLTWPFSQSRNRGNCQTYLRCVGAISNRSLRNLNTKCILSHERFHWTKITQHTFLGVRPLTLRLRILVLIQLRKSKFPDYEREEIRHETKTNSGKKLQRQNLAESLPTVDDEEHIWQRILTFRRQPEYEKA